MTGEAQTFHRTALLTQALMALFSLGALIGAVALGLYAFLGLFVLSWQVAAGLCLVSAVGILVCLWWATLPDPVLIIDAAGLDWRLPDGPAARIGWDQVAGYALCGPDDLLRMGHKPPPERKGERCLVIHLKQGADFHAAYDADVAQGLDEVLAALRRWRPDLEKDA